MVKRKNDSCESNKRRKEFGSQKTTVFHDKERFNSGFSALEQFRREEKHCDVCLIVEEKLIHAHRVVLAATFPYFDSMFTHKMKEANEYNIRMEEVDASAIESLVNFAYTGTIEISSDNVEKVMSTAALLLMKSVQDECAKVVLDMMTPDNVIGIRKFADSLGACPSLFKASDRYIEMHFKAVSESDEFLDIPFEHIRDLLKKDNLNVDSEKIVLAAVIKWTNKDELNRIEYFPQLLTMVRLLQITTDYLDQVAAEDIIKSNPMCKALIDQARNKAKPRFCEDSVGIIYSVGGVTVQGSVLNNVEMFDPITEKWTKAESMPTSIYAAGIAVLGNCLYVIGGADENDVVLETVQVFDAESKLWSNVSPMNSPREAPAVVAFGDNIYVFGGRTPEQLFSSTVERYDPSNDTWSVLPTMKTRKGNARAVQLQGQIYVLGGWIKDEVTAQESNVVEVFDPNTLTWKETQPMLSRRFGHGVATLDGKIFACGGFDGSTMLKSVECFDPVTEKWSYVQSMRTCRSEVCLASVMGKLYAIGGTDVFDEDGNLTSYLDSVEMYCPESDTWSYVATLDYKKHSAGVGVLPRVFTGSLLKQSR